MYHAGLYNKILEFIKKNIKSGRQSIIIIKKDSKSLEGFSEEYIGEITPKVICFEGVKLYKC